LLNLPEVTPQLAYRLISAERDCYVDWVRAMEAQPDNAFGIAVQQFGGATAILCSRVGAQVWNRIFHLSPAELEHVPAILEFYKTHGAQPLFDLSPYNVPPDWEAPHMTRTLAGQYGLFQANFHQMLYGVPTVDVPITPDHIVIQEVQAANRMDFKNVYEQVWGGGEEIAVLIEQANFRCYLAYIDDEPVALGVLHIANRAGSMANALTIPPARGKGCQTALLYHRFKQAAIEDCDLLVSQCMPGSQSQHNQLRVGFHIAGSKAWWIPQNVI
jgi:hypothetical protein